MFRDANCTSIFTATSQASCGTCSDHRIGTGSAERQRDSPPTYVPKELMNVMASTLVHPGTAHAASGCLGLAAAAVTGSHAAAEDEDLMTRRQVAMLFRVTSAVVATWARRGRLPEVRNSDGRPRYRRGDVEQLFRTEVARRLR